MAWLSLAAAALLALLPAGGAVVCLGHEGHVGLGAEAVETGCPCEHESTAVPTKVLADAEDGRHPPCDDFALDPPEVFHVTGIGQRLPDDPGDPIDEGFLATGPASAALDSLGAAPRATPRTRCRSAAGAMRSPQLEHRRVVVLLI